MMRWRQLSKTSIALLAIALILCLAVTPQQANAATATITPSSADTTISSQFQSTHYGGTTALSVEGGPYDYRAIVKFDLSSVPAGSTIDNAQLQLYFYMFTGSPFGQSYTAYRVTKDWSEQDADWIDAGFPFGSWTTPGGDFTTDGASSGTVPANIGQYMSWDVTAIVKAWIQNVQANYGFLILDPTIGSPDGRAIFYSREAESNRPILTIEYSLQTAAPVGGLVESVNTVALLSPWLAVIAVVGCIGTAVVVAKKRRASWVYRRR